MQTKIYKRVLPFVLFGSCGDGSISLTVFCWRDYCNFHTFWRLLLRFYIRNSTIMITATTKINMTMMATTQENKCRAPVSWIGCRPAHLQRVERWWRHRWRKDSAWVTITKNSDRELTRQRRQMNTTRVNRTHPCQNQPDPPLVIQRRGSGVELQTPE